MKKIWIWVIGITAVLLIGFTILFATGLLFNQRMPMSWYGSGEQQEWQEDYWRGPGMGMHTGFRGLPGFGMFGWLLMLVFPVGFLALVVLGIVLLVRALQQPSGDQPKLTRHQCENCGKEVEGHWKLCPYCGEPLRKE